VLSVILIWSCRLRDVTCLRECGGQQPVYCFSAGAEA
jgi:hypothetical protein